MKRIWGTSRLIIAIIITTLCTLGIISHQFLTSIAIDEKTIFFFALGIFPWLTLFFKKFKIPGFEGESFDRTQSSTDNPPPPKTTDSKTDISGDVNDDSKKILSTLWRYQKQHFRDDSSRRWTFTVQAKSTEYKKYINGLSELLNKDLVTVNPENNQILLSNEGLLYIENHSDIQKHADIYKF